MKEIKETCYKGTRILLGSEKRQMINGMINILTEGGFEEISIPIIQSQDTFAGKVGNENQNMMFDFQDRAGRNLCLSPEYTAVIQKLAKTTFKYQKDVKLFYVQECFRGEKPQAGRYRQFTQLGVEIINPSKQYDLSQLAMNLLQASAPASYEVNTDATRGLDYYVGGKGFEITRNDLGNAKQICGGGTYEGGVGFAIGIDRILTIK